jgi:NADH-quinone oxidoreductase subunit C
MTKIDLLVDQLKTEFSDHIQALTVLNHEVTIECTTLHLKPLLLQLRDNTPFSFDQLIDVCAVDDLSYGEYDWETEPATDRGFSRAVEVQESRACVWEKPRFAVVYHLLSTSKNQRLRVKVYLEESHLVIPSVIDIWLSANWFGREAYDLFGILFEGHPDLRRILTDYGFIGHPFRKDFPVSGHVEMRYDATLQKVIYAPVDIEPRVTVPKVIRHPVSRPEESKT